MSDVQNIFCLAKDLIFKLNRKVEKGERNDKMTRESKSKAFLLKPFGPQIQILFLLIFKLFMIW